MTKDTNPKSNIFDIQIETPVWNNPILQLTSEWPPCDWETNNFDCFDYSLSPHAWALRLAGWSDDVPLCGTGAHSIPDAPDSALDLPSNATCCTSKRTTTEQTRGGSQQSVRADTGGYCGQQRWNTSLHHGAPWPLQHATCPLEACPLCLFLLCPGNARTKKTVTSNCLKIRFCGSFWNFFR